MEKMKERVVAFGDAIIAIIITIIVLELPIKLTSSGDVELYVLFRSIGIYFISFCFVGDLWYQGAQKFLKVKKIKNKDFVLHMFFLFALSLVPTFTRLLIEDTNRQVVFFYGILSLIVSFLWSVLLLSLNRQIEEKDQLPDYFRKRENKRQTVLLAFRLIVLLVAFFFPKFGLLVYLILPIVGFMHNVIDNEENSYVEQMNTDQKNYYVNDLRRDRGSNVRKYIELLRSSMNDDSTSSEERQQWWTNFNQQWNTELDKKIADADQRLKNAKNEEERRSYDRELQRLMMEKQKIQKVVERAGDRVRHYERQQQKQQRRRDKKD